ncbi:hypothetical protein [Isoptericola sp. BMS4]|uniref:hypothetical protein n=1 Tax=Isoptericola sp. BMS4 TaxID=2527875 RepID=UPI0014212C3B|nr:hypothetical protein [Isoptericola sp. BMS4]
MTRTPRRRAALTVGLPALAAGGLLAGFGVLDPVHAAVLPVTVAAVAFVWRAVDAGRVAQWPQVPEHRREGARKDVSDLGWATFTSSGAVGDRMRRRVLALASARLRDRGIDLAAGPGSRDRAAADRLLGADVVDGLTGPRAASRAEVHRWLDALDALDEPPDARPRARDRRPEHPSHGRSPA